MKHPSLFVNFVFIHSLIHSCIHSVFCQHPHIFSRTENYGVQSSRHKQSGERGTRLCHFAKHNHGASTQVRVRAAWVKGAGSLQVCVVTAHFFPLAEDKSGDEASDDMMVISATKQ